MENVTEIGERIRMARVNRRMSQLELANVSGVCRQTISALENGRARSANVGTLAALADAMDIPVEYFFAMNVN